MRVAAKRNAQIRKSQISNAQPLECHPESEVRGEGSANNVSHVAGALLADSSGRCRSPQNDPASISPASSLPVLQAKRGPVRWMTLHRVYNQQGRTHVRGSQIPLEVLRVQISESDFEHRLH
jgi:hypothetical protein